MRMLKQLTFAAMVAGGSMSAAMAATVQCAPSPVPVAETRYVEITGGKTGGLCARFDGNLDSDPAFDALNLTLIDKDDRPDGQGEGALGYSILGGTIYENTKGGWSFDDSLWTSWNRLFLGFHFGGGQGSPDSFVVELDRRSIAGTWEFLRNGSDTGPLNGLSSIRLLRDVACTGDICDASPPPTGMPEPASLALVGLGLVSAAWVRRRKQR